LRALERVAGQDCQIIGGKRIEALVVEAFLEVSAAAGTEAAALAGETLRLEIEATERSWRLQIEKAEYEAKRAERHYLAVEPENRTLACELERRWNERLVELEALRAQAARPRKSQRPLSDEELARAQELGTDLLEAWNAPTTAVRLCGVCLSELSAVKAGCLQLRRARGLPFVHGPASKTTSGSKGQPRCAHRTGAHRTRRKLGAALLRSDQLAWSRRSAKRRSGAELAAARLSHDIISARQQHRRTKCR
jgi:hypothetical protein